MVPFAYDRADTIGAAIASGAGHASDRTGSTGADFFAGGTDLMQLMKEGLRHPGRVIDITALPGLDRIDVTSDGIRLGALVRMSDGAAHAVVGRDYALISQALLASASPGVRNMATLGGNLLQRTRCGYFRDAGAPCNKRDPGSGCPASHGQNRNHAILGGGEDCIATYAGDLANALLALDAVVEVAGPGGPRSIALADLHRIPGGTPSIETQLVDGELIVAIDVPASAAGRRSHYLKVRDRASFEWSIASAAVALDMDGEGLVHDVRIAVGGVATKPWRLPQVEARLRGARLTETVVREASSGAGDGAVPRGCNGHKVELVRRTVARALREAGGLA